MATSRRQFFRALFLLGVVVLNFGAFGWTEARGRGDALAGLSVHPRALKSESNPDAESFPIMVVCTTAMVAEMVREVGGVWVEVTQLMGEGTDPHLYKATASDVKAIDASDIVFTNGLMLEGRMQDVLQRFRERGRRVVAIGDAVPHDKLRHPPGFHGEADPHIWMDPALWGLGTELVRDTLTAHGPSQADEFNRRAVAYGKKVDAVAAEVAALMNRIPPSRRLLVTAHDAFGYFGRAYGIEVAGVQGVSTDSESGLADLRRLVDRLVAAEVPAVFAESSVADKGVRALIEGAEARGHRVRLGGMLYSDAMGKPGTPDGTYPGMLLHNARVISEALAPVSAAAPVPGAPDAG